MGYLQKNQIFSNTLVKGVIQEGNSIYVNEEPFDDNEVFENYFDLI